MYVVDASVPTEQSPAAAAGESHHVLLPAQHSPVLPREQEVCPSVRPIKHSKIKIMYSFGSRIYMMAVKESSINSFKVYNLAVLYFTTICAPYFES